MHEIVNFSDVLTCYATTKLKLWKSYNTHIVFDGDGRLHVMNPGKLLQ